MKKIKCLDRQVVIDRGLDALYEGLGPVEARRFLAIAHAPHKYDSVARHRKLQAGLNREAFLAEMRSATRSAKK